MKQIDYLKFMSRKVIENSTEDEPVIHLLSGGKFTIRRYEKVQLPLSIAPILMSKRYKFSDHCDCKVKNKCNKVLPIVLSNN